MLRLRITKTLTKTSIFGQELEQTIFLQEIKEEHFYKILASIDKIISVPNSEEWPIQTRQD